MLEFLPAEVEEGLAHARKQARLRAHRAGTRLSLHLGAEVFPLLRIWDGGFALDAGRVAALRGCAEIHDGPRHVSSGLIIASEVNDGELICTFKRVSPALERAALDYAAAPDAPAGLLPRD